MTWGEFKKLGDKAIKDDEELDWIDTTGVYALNGLHVCHDKDTDRTVITGTEHPGLLLGGDRIE